MPSLFNLIFDNDKKKRFALVWAWLSIIIGIASAVVAATTFFNFPTLHNAPESASIDSKVAQIQQQCASIAAELNALKSVGSSQTNAPFTGEATAIAGLSIQVSNVVSRIGKLEDAIQATPDKALSIPMLRKDLESIQQIQNESKTVLESEIGRLYEFNKWFFGLIALMALSNAGLAFSAARGGKDKGTKGSEPEI